MNYIGSLIGDLPYKHRQAPLVSDNKEGTDITVLISPFRVLLLDIQFDFLIFMLPSIQLFPLHLLLRLCEPAKLQYSCKKLNLLSELMDHSGNYVHTALPFILSLLQRGFGQRISLLTHSLSPEPKVREMGSHSPMQGSLSWHKVDTDTPVLQKAY